MRTFSPEEEAAIDGLYRDENWFEMLYQFSDAVEDRCPGRAEFLRWMCDKRMRPWNGNSKVNPFQWWCVVEGMTRGWTYCACRNYLPEPMRSVCRNRDGVKWDECGFPTPSAAIDAAAGLWITLSREARSEMWKWHSSRSSTRT